MSGSEVSEPCPISAAGDMIDTVLSGEIVTHGLRATSPVRAAASARRPDETGKVRPAPPTMKPRRVTPALRIAMGKAQNIREGGLTARIVRAQVPLRHRLVLRCL